MTITEFLLARIAEDEATEASRFRPRLSTSTQFETTTYPAVGIVVLQTVDDAWDTRTISWREYQEEYCDPAPNERMLAECAAKRAIIEDYLHTYRVRSEMDRLNRNPAIYYGLPSDRVIRQLAAVYSTHPDYDESWRP